MTSDNCIWCALAEFVVRPECKVDYLMGARGGYVHAFATADSSREFADRVGLALKRLDLTPRKLEEIEEVDDPEVLSQEWSELCSHAISSGDVVFSEFFLYNQEDDLAQES